MTTHQQMKKLFSAVASQYPELQIIGPRKLVLRPVGQLVRGIIMDRTSIADLPNQDWFIGFTCDPTRWLTAASGRFQPADFQMKYWSYPRHQEIFIEIMESEVLPLLKSVETIADFMALRHPSDVVWRRSLESGMTRLCLHAAIGCFDIVDEEAHKLIAAGYRKTPWWSEETYIKVIEDLWPLTQRDDRPAVAALLHEWERQFIELHGIQHIYEKRPFSFEANLA